MRTLGPDSLTWRYFGDTRIAFVISQAFVLQIAHPVIDAAVETQSTYKEDPWGRAQRSFKYLWPVVYNRPTAAIDAGAFLRNFHRAIKGTDKYGRSYDGLDPEAYLWVHATAYDGMIRVARLMHNRDLTPAELDRLYAEWHIMGQLLGIAEEEMPADRAEFAIYFDNMIRDTLAYTDSVDYWLSRTFMKNLKAPSTRVPSWIWRPLLRPTASMFDILLRTSLPESFRTRFDIGVSSIDRRVYHGLAHLANLIRPLLPLRLKYVPYAWQAVADARRHPDAYEGAA